MKQDIITTHEIVYFFEDTPRNSASEEEHAALHHTIGPAARPQMTIDQFFLDQK
jgi:hypothetical protein